MGTLTGPQPMAAFSPDGRSLTMSEAHGMSIGVVELSARSSCLSNKRNLGLGEVRHRKGRDQQPITYGSRNETPHDWRNLSKATQSERRDNACEAKKAKLKQPGN